MAHTNPRHLRFVRTARRSHLARLAAAGAIVVVPAACGNDDAEVFGNAATETATDIGTLGTDTDTDNIDTGGTDTAGTADTADTTPTSGTDPLTTATESTASATAGAAVPSTAEMVVDFTYVAESSDGRVNNPYIAVWVEDLDGNLVETISVWYAQSDDGGRWLDDLSSWYNASGGEALTSGATRAAGTYSVVWDATGIDGSAVSSGQYVVYVESAREHGPHSITAVEVALGAEDVVAALPDDSELVDVTVSYTV